tara:strand:- start:1006 stop:1245 length:240 start_codon:yes stop_codon:yes gene_type:complete
MQKHGLLSHPVFEVLNTKGESWAFLFVKAFLHTLSTPTLFFEDPLFIKSPKKNGRIIPIHKHSVLVFRLEPMFKLFRKF